MKNVLITGASRGIGNAIALRLARDGYRVLINYNRSSKHAKETLDLILDNNGYADMFKANVASWQEVQEMLRYFCSKYDNIFGLVLNAGIYIRKDIYDMSIDDWKETIDVNLNGAMYPIKAALNCLNEGSSIVFISSQLAFRGSKSSVAYGASKAGVLGLMRSLAIQLAPNIRVNAIAPGTIDTDIISSYTREQRLKRAQEIPLARIGKPDEVAAAVSFLLSDESKYITGATIDVNGGLYIH